MARAVQAVLTPDVGTIKQRLTAPPARPELPAPGAFGTLGMVVPQQAGTVVANLFTLGDKLRLPGTIYLYHVHVYAWKTRENTWSDDLAPQDLSKEEAFTLLTRLKREVAQQLPNCHVSYDGRTRLQATERLPASLLKREENVGRSKVRIDIDEVGRSHPPATQAEWMDLPLDEALMSLQALDIALVNFASWEQSKAKPKWVMSGRNLFLASESGNDLGDGAEALVGWHASMRVTKRGLALLCDLSACAFLASGNMVELFCSLVGCPPNDLARQLSRDRRASLRVEAAIKGRKVIIEHGTKSNTKVHMTRKARGLGPSADSYKFRDDQGRQWNVTEYWRDKHGVVLKFPGLPCVNFAGPKKDPVLYPAELIWMPPGQKAGGLSGDQTAMMIRSASKPPNDRLQHTLARNSALHAITEDPDARALGVSDISKTPLTVTSRVLPAPEIKYRESTLNVGMAGAWNAKGAKLFETPGLEVWFDVVVMAHNVRFEQSKDFARTLAQMSTSMGLNMRVGEIIEAIGSPKDQIIDMVQGFADKRLREKAHRTDFFVLFILGNLPNEYNCIKTAADGHGLVTQAMLSRHAQRPSPQYAANLVLKINAKLGGLVSTLAPVGAAPHGGAPAPAQLSWIFDNPVMVMGVDVTHAEPGSTRPSVAAVVASMNGRLPGQYAAELRRQALKTSGEREIVQELQDATESLLRAFMRRKTSSGAEQGQPWCIVVYRDGVSDGQLRAVLQYELPALQEACANVCKNPVRIVLLVAQKRHHLRLYFCPPGGQGGAPQQAVNPCPGLVADTECCSSHVSDFFLCSHAAIQGTSRPTRYTVAFDEVGLTADEVQLMTYWICFLYCRATRSVSLATPAYYAHHCATRGRVWLSEYPDMSNEDMAKRCAKWADADNGMFFV
ncbi:unnamed protein product [Pedinophyceae sp. YPF-701]|nr:unnamed protein product [Pedinophyceae sp. YPF-701]